jgi:nitrilase
VFSACYHWRNVPTDFEFYKDFSAERLDVIFADGPAIYSQTQEIVARLEPGVAGIISHELDRATLHRARQSFDPAGHRARPGIFALAVYYSRICQ